MYRLFVADTRSNGYKTRHATTRKSAVLVVTVNAVVAVALRTHPVPAHVECRECGGHAVMATRACPSACVYNGHALRVRDDAACCRVRVRFIPRRLGNAGDPNADELIKPNGAQRTVYFRLQGGSNFLYLTDIRHNTCLVYGLDVL